MRSKGVTWGLLIGIVLLGTGASMDGLREARDWQYAGDIAAANGQPMVAYGFYEKSAHFFAGTPHGEWAAQQAMQMKEILKQPAISPGEDEPWTVEFLDHFTWPQPIE